MFQFKGSRQLEQVERRKGNCRCYCSVTGSCLILCDLPCPSPSPGVFSNSCPLSQWCHPTILSSVITFFSCLQSFPAAGSFPMNWLFALGGQSIGALASVLSMNIQSWFPLGLTGLISLLSMGLSRVFSSNTIQKQLFFDIQHSLCSNSHIHTRLWLQTLFLSYLPIMLSMSNFPNSLCLLFLFSLHSLNLDFSYLHRYLVTYFCPNLFY